MRIVSPKGTIVIRLGKFSRKGYRNNPKNQLARGLSPISTFPIITNPFFHKHIKYEVRPDDTIHANIYKTHKIIGTNDKNNTKHEGEL
jgi:hypothetical protein